MNKDQLIYWLLEGDPSIQYQTYRDLLEVNKKSLQNKISKEGWGTKYLSLQNIDGHWGKAFYQPKWTSTHYTLLDLRNLSISPNVKSIKMIILSILKKEMDNTYFNKYEMIVNKDICINGMVLNYASYFKVDEILLKPLLEIYRYVYGAPWATPPTFLYQLLINSQWKMLLGVPEFKLRY